MVGGGGVTMEVTDAAAILDSTPVRQALENNRTRKRISGILVWKPCKSKMSPEPFPALLNLECCDLLRLRLRLSRVAGLRG